MRPILSATGTYNFKLAEWLDKLLKPLASNEHMIRDIPYFSDHKTHLTIRRTWFLEEKNRKKNILNQIV
jgi:hypothetical protein